MHKFEVGELVINQDRGSVHYGWTGQITKIEYYPEGYRYHLLFEDGKEVPWFSENELTRTNNAGI